MPHQINAPTSETLAQLRRVLADAEAVDGSSAFSDQAIVAAAQGTRTLFGIACPDGRATEFAGFALCGAGEVDLVVHPNFRGSGLGTAALRELISFSRAQHPHSSSAVTLRAWSHGTQPAPRALLTGAGFTGIRTLYKMTLDATQLPAAVAQARPLPDGVRIESFAAQQPQHTDAWLRINAAAFASHPEQGAVTREEFTALTHEPWFESNDLNFAVLDTATPTDNSTTESREPSDGPVPNLTQYAGFSWVKTVAHPSAAGPETELYVLGVHPDAAGTGLGAALFGIALQRMAAHSPAKVALYVDASNTNAVTLYERAGFTVAEQSTQWEGSFTVS